MVFFESLLVAMSTYSVIPMPQFEWNERNMKYAICFFPAVGVVCGLGLWGWYALCVALKLSAILFAAGAVALPLLITGGIHMDGYMDTTDALASHQLREKKLEILKDPHCGAFAVIYCGIYLVLNFGLMYQLFETGNVLVLCPIYILSRALSGFCAVTMPNARKSGMLCAYTQNTDKHKAMAATLIVAALAGIGLLMLSPIVGGCVVICAGLSVLYYRLMTMKQFGGVTGDTAGFFLQICELSALFGGVIGSLILGVIA